MSILLIANPDVGVSARPMYHIRPLAADVDYANVTAKISFENTHFELLRL